MAYASTNIHFGGPDKQKHLLRDVLLQHIQAVPSGGNISWLCYYLNEPILFDALIAASKRGVKIDIIIDGNPRSPEINQLCMETFSASKYPLINIVLANSKPFWEYIGIHWHPHLHSKLYYFSHPTPQVLIGSYNPTAGIEQISECLIEKIGDHSISHNVLVSIHDETTVSLLNNYILGIKNSCKRVFARYLPSHNKTHSYKENDNQWEINFLPRIRMHPVDSLLSKNNDDATIKCAISHFKGLGILKPLKSALKNNKKIELLLESSQRRTSSEHLQFLDQHNIKYYQPKLSNHCLMHNKFILYKSGQEHCVMFGSFNWSARSRLLNHEIIACTHNKDIVAAFENRWDQMAAAN